MRPSYLLAVGDGQAGWTELVAALASRTGLGLQFDRPQVAALVNPDCPCLAAGSEACIVGTLFPCHGPAEQIKSLGPADSAAICRQEDHLLRHYWGGYVALFADGKSVRVMRDPSGALPCYYARTACCILFASDMEILLKTGLVSVELDWSELGNHFWRTGVPASETCLKGVKELLPGFVLDHREGPGRQLCSWSPWDQPALAAIPEPCAGQG